MRKVEVTEYNPRWPAMYEKEAQILHAVFGDELLAVHHIGSTAVAGLAAKPVIDILPVVGAIARVDDYTAALMEAGYEPEGENGLPGRRFFQKGGDARTHHLHVYEDGNPEIGRHLAFRDYLRTHPDALQAYGALKQKLAQRYPADIGAYVKGKEQLVKSLEKQAITCLCTKQS